MYVAPNVPVNPTSPMTVALCATSKNRLLPPRTRSTLLVCALRAASWAARRRRTRSSGVSPGSLLPPEGFFGVEESFVAAGVFACGEVCCCLGFGVEGAAALEAACGVVEVKRVASEALRGDTLEAIAFDGLYSNDSGGYRGGEVRE